MLYAAYHLSDELERLALVVAQRRVVLGNEPVVDLVLANHRVTALVLDHVVGHQEVAQEAKWLLFPLFQRLGDLLPLVFELAELRLLDLCEEQVLEQVHRVKAHAALVDGLENLQSAAHIGGDLDEHHVVGQIDRASVRRRGDEQGQHATGGDRVAAGDARPLDHGAGHCPLGARGPRLRRGRRDLRAADVRGRLGPAVPCGADPDRAIAGAPGHGHVRGAGHRCPDRRRLRRHARHDDPTKEGGGGMMKPDESIQIFVPLKVRKQNGRPKIMPPATYLPSEDRTQDPHILRAIGRAWGWRRRIEAGEFNTVTDLAKAVGLAERHVSRQLRLAYLAPGVLKRLVYKREVPAVTLLKLTDVAALPWHEQPERVFD